MADKLVSIFHTFHICVCVCVLYMCVYTYCTHIELPPEPETKFICIIVPLKFTLLNNTHTCMHIMIVSRTMQVEI